MTSILGVAFSSSASLLPDPGTHSNPPKKAPAKLKLSLPQAPSPQADFGNAEWFWFEGKRIRRPLEPRFGEGNDYDDSVDSDYNVGVLDLGVETPYLGTPSSASSIADFPRTSISVDPVPQPTNDYFGRSAEADLAKLPQPTDEKRLVKEWAAAVTGSIEKASQRAPPTTWKPAPSSTRGFTGSGRKTPTGSSKKRDVPDRDCGICFEYAVKPCRTRCCGKIFCREHLRDWLHGTNASGLCPNCDLPCSLEDTLNLASPTLRSPADPTPNTIAATQAFNRTLTPQSFERLQPKQRAPSSPLSTSTPITHHRKQSAEINEPQTIIAARSTSASASSPAASMSPMSSLSEKRGLALGGVRQGPTQFIKPGTNGLGKLHQALHPLRESLVADWSSSLPLGSDDGSESGSKSPSMWTPKAIETRGKPAGFNDSIFYGTRGDASGTLKHVASLVAVLLLLYVIVG